MHSIRSVVLLSIFFLPACFLHAQDCQSSVTVQLKNIQGGFFANQQVSLISKVDGRMYTEKTNAQGEATLKVPCKEMYDLEVLNYTKKIEIESPQNGSVRQTLSYSPDMIQKEKLMAMSSAEQAAVDEFFKSLPDTTIMKTAVMPPPKTNADYYGMLVISVRDINNAALADETLWLSGRKRKKSIQGTTDKGGRLIAYLPKGDIYDINFKYNQEYYSAECAYSKGSTDIKVSFSYLGTKEIERRRKEEAERLQAEEKRLQAEKERFEKRCAALGLSLEECHRREAEKYKSGEYVFDDTVINLVLNRNKWEDKLIVCDVTGSMNPYVAQLSTWYRLNYLNDKNTQFVFFNDGDGKPDDKKKLGETGGIYYSKAKTIDSLDRFMSRVQALGSGGDAPENNMEALIKAVKMAAPFKELVMIADNHAPVKDIKLLASFRKPVHIILCGVDAGWILADYLKVAWKTKGTLHTIEEDITTLARLSEGQEITIGGITYRIMGGEFVQVSK